MPVSGNPFATLKKGINALAKDQRVFTTAAAKAVKELIREQFERGIDPSGHAQPDTVRHTQGMLSKTLWRAISVKAEPHAVVGEGVLTDRPKHAARRQWLMAHQLGHTFPARQSVGNRIAFNAKGQRVSIAKLRKATFSTKGGVRTQNSKRVTVGERDAYWREQKSKAKLLGRTTTSKAHKVGARVLPVRLIYPIGDLPLRWQQRINVRVWETREAIRRAVSEGALPRSALPGASAL